MNFWSVLGLAPGQDMAAIKKAYAAKLRTTRPDDDAGAYQQLREAYDAAVRHAKGASNPAAFPARWTEPAPDAPPAEHATRAPDTNSETRTAQLPPTDAPAPAPSGTPAPPPFQDDLAAQAAHKSAAAQKAAAARQAAAIARARLQWANATAAPPVSTIDLGELIKRTLDLWKKHGDEALQAHWPQLRSVLADCSLAQAQACSTAFAQMIMSEATLPAVFVDQLRQFFGWGSDYRRMPRLAGHDAVDFKRRLADVAQQLDRIKVQAEQDRLDAIDAAERVRKEALALEELTRAKSPLVARFASMMARASPLAGKMYAFLIGPSLLSQWSGLTKQQRLVLGIDYETFANGIGACRDGLRLRSVLGLAALLLGLLMAIVKGGLPVYAALAVVALGACYALPLYQWQETLRARLYPKRLLAVLMTADQLDPRHARKYGVVLTSLAFFHSLLLQPAFVSGEGRYTFSQALVALFLLACQWLFPPDGEETRPDAVIPVLILCMVACRTLGITDLLTLLSLGTCWHAVARAARNKTWGTYLGIIWALPLVMIHWNLQEHGLEHSIIPVSLIAPWVVLLLARLETARFAIATVAVAVVSQPFANQTALALWTAALAVGAACIAALMRWSAPLVAKRFSTDEPC